MCIQEADGNTFHSDFDFMSDVGGGGGYDYVLHKKFRFRCATFYKRDKFILDKVAHKDRTLVTTLRRRQCLLDDDSSTADDNDTSSSNTIDKNENDKHHQQLQQQVQEEDNILHIINCHLSGGAAPERRLRQVHDGIDTIRKWNNALQNEVSQYKKQGKRQSKNIIKAQHAYNEYINSGMVVCGDFNSDGNTAVRKLLVEGTVDPDWKEQQYPTLQLTSKCKTNVFGTFTDALELAFGGNVCDGDYSENPQHMTNSVNIRPATYVVPNLASLLLLPVSSEDNRPPRTQFGNLIARGLADSLNLKNFCQSELDLAFELVDDDGNGMLDSEEVQTLLERAYVETYGAQIEQERNNFFRGFGRSRSRSRSSGQSNNDDDDDDDDDGLTKEQFISRLKALQQDAEGERKAFGLARGLNLKELSEVEMEQAFDEIDLDGNALLDEDEFQQLLETAYTSIYGDEIERSRSEFFAGFSGGAKNNGNNEASDGSELSLTREQFTERLLALHQELEGGRLGSELAEVRTNADAEKVIDRFTPLLQQALDEVFAKFSSNGSTLTQAEVDTFLILTNGELGRGGTFRHTTAIFEQKIKSSENGKEEAELTLQDWYSVFARELSEGKWWQVVYDLEVCGVNVRSLHSPDSSTQFYQGWLDYIYFQRLDCSAVQDVLTEEERQSIYTKGDALPNSWHPSDHLPVAAIFSWKSGVTV